MFGWVFCLFFLVGGCVLARVFFGGFVVGIIELHEFRKDKMCAITTQIVRREQFPIQLPIRGDLSRFSEEDWRAIS